MRDDSLIATGQNNGTPFKPLRFKKCQQGDSVFITGHAPPPGPFDRCLNRLHKQICVFTEVEDVIEDATYRRASVGRLIGISGQLFQTLKTFGRNQKRLGQRGGVDGLANRLGHATLFYSRCYLENFIRGNSLIKSSILMEESFQALLSRGVKPAEIGIDRQDRVASIRLFSGEKAELQSEEGKQALNLFIA